MPPEIWNIQPINDVERKNKLRDAIARLESESSEHNFETESDPYKRTNQETEQKRE